MKRTKLILLFFFFQCIIASNIYSQISLKADNYFYRKTTRPSTSLTFTARIRNIGSSGAFVYAIVVLTAKSNSSINIPASEGTPQTIQPGVTTSYELAPSPNPTFIIPAGGRTQISLTVTAPSLEGNYSVSILIFNAFTDAKLLSIFGSFPIQIGNPTQALNVHPSRISFGKLKYGRFMYPIPLKIRYKIILPNRLGDVQPWALRIYTDNANKFTGIPGSIRRLSPSGLVHSSGKYTIAIKFWNLNWGPDPHSTGWDSAVEGPPPIDDDIFWKGVQTDESTPNKSVRDYDLKPWLGIPDLEDMTVEPDTWKRTVGVFTYDGQFVNQTNRAGDYQLSNPPAEPFDVYLAVDIGSTAVRGKYSGRLILELISP